MADADHGTAHDAEGVYCPSCGYDLRGSLTGERGRCPECGSEFDRAALSRSLVPWIHRAEIGRLKAWWRTCWMALFRPKDLAPSLNAPMPYAEARRFWILCATIACVPGAIAASESPAFAGAPIPGLGQPFSSAASPGLQWFGYNLYAPWAAGFYLRPVAMLCAALAALMATGAMSYLFQFAPLPPRLQDRSAALGLYTSGALVSGFITGLAVIAVILLLIIALGEFDQAWQVALGWAVPFTLLAWWFAVWRTYRRVSHAGVMRSIVAGALIIAVTLLAIFYAVLFIPWCVGVVRILISALEVQT